jgi:hypothetical protein
MSEQDFLALDRIRHARTDFGKVESQEEHAPNMVRTISLRVGNIVVTIGLGALMR